MIPVLPILATLALQAAPATQPAAGQRAVPPDGIELAEAAGGPAADARVGGLTPLTLISGPMPTTFDVTDDGVIFSAFPRWRDPVNYTVARIDPETAELTPFPDAATNAYVPGGDQDPAEHFVCVQAVHLDPDGRLWVLDTGSVNMGGVVPGGAKLWAYDPDTGGRLRAITFDVGDDRAVRPDTYLNDVRLDLTRGDAGYAFVTDSGAGGVIVVDLASGAARRTLGGEPALAADLQVSMSLQAEGRALRSDPPGRGSGPIRIETDGVALDADRGLLYLTALINRELVAVSVDELIDPDAEPTVVKLATMPSANDGIVLDDAGRLYTTDFEDNAIRRYTIAGDPATGLTATEELIVQDGRLLWPDCVIVNGDVGYVSSNQLHRQPQFNNGRDLRRPPYVFFTFPIPE